MYKVRRLQKRGKQWMINVPADLVLANGWKKGVYLEINPKGNYGLDLRKFADDNMPRLSVELEALKREEFALESLINMTRPLMSPGEFSGRLAQQSCIQGKIRRLEQRLSNKL